jgi:hypothetical protein
MTLTDIIVIAVIGLIVGAAVGYIVKAKRKGQTCIGCPYSSSCPSGKGGCGCAEKQDK